MQHSQGQRRWKPQGGRAETALLAEFLRVVNAWRHRPDHEQTGQLNPVLSVEPDVDGLPRLLCSTLSGALVRVTLRHIDDDGREVTPDDIVKVELLVATTEARTRIPARGDGPLPNTQWLSAEEYEMAAGFYRELLSGARFEAVTVSHDVEWPQWVFIEIPRPGRRDQHIVIALPLACGPWGEARESGFLFLVNATAPSTRRARLRLDARVHLCDPVRRHTVVDRAQ